MPLLGNSPGQERAAFVTLHYQQLELKSLEPTRNYFAPLHH